MTCCFILTLAGCGYSVSGESAGALLVSPNTIDFGDVLIGQAASTKIALFNHSTEPVNVAQLNVAGQPFFLNGQNPFPVTIAPGTTYSVDLGFKPNDDASYSGEFTAVDSAARQIARGSLSGSGVAAGRRGLSVSPTSLSFGNVAVGTTTTLPVTLTATGGSAVTINSVALSGGTAFSVSGATFPLKLNPKQSVTLQVQFAPATPTAMTGTLRINSSSFRHSTTTVSLSGTGITATIPQLLVSPTSLNFSNVAVGKNSTLPVTLTSTGTSAVTISSADISGAGFSVSGANFPLTLNPNQTATLNVRFAPTSASALAGTLTINSNARRHSTIAVNLRGTGTAATTAQLTVSPTSLSFGNVNTGSSTTQTVTLASSGTGSVTVNSAAISGAGFSVSGASFPLTLNSKQTATLTVKFAPTKTGAVTGSLTINSNASTNATATVSLSGTGTAPTTGQLTVSPTSLSFGNVNTGSSTTQTVTLTSSGTGSVTVNSAAISGAGFSVSGATFPLTLNSKQTATLSVKFSPTKTGAVTGSLTINSNASTNATTTVSLSGTGTAATTAQLTVSPTSLSFGNVNTGSSTTQTVTLTSSGTGSVTINSATISGTGFSVSGATFPVTLSSKQTATLTVKFAPTKTGAVTGSLTINSNASTNATTTVSLSGTGTAATTAQLTVSPTSLSFGNVNTGSSTTQTVTLTSSGTGAVTVNSAAITGAGFSVSGATFPLTLNSKQTATLTVKFAPTATGAVTGSLTISSNASTNATTTVSLSGTGTAATTAQLTVSPTSLSFGDVNPGSNATLSITLTSSGTGSVTVNSATISGTGFSVSGATFPVTLSSKQAVTLAVKFAPTTTGAVTGKLTINSNASTNATVTVSLSGTGATAQHEVDLSWTAPSSTTAKIQGYNVYRATGTSTSYQKLNSSVDTTTDYTDSTVQGGTTYTYVVKSVDSSGTESIASNIFTASIP